MAKSRDIRGRDEKKKKKKPKQVQVPPPAPIGFQHHAVVSPPAEKPAD